MNQDMPLVVKGHVNVTDDLGNVLLDRDNAVHPQNMSRIIARALSNESNYYINRIAFGNGGTQTDIAFTITYKTPNDGQPPDVRTWDSRLYNETYSEIIDEGSTLSPNGDIGLDPGSAGPNVGTRPGGGADPSGDPASIPHVSGPGVRSNELGLTSEVVITSVLNPGEPTGQFATDGQSPTEDTESSFSFDEIGLYTTGSPAADANGIADIDVGNRSSTDDTGLLANTSYSFLITVDGAGSPTPIAFTTPVAGGSGPGQEILYGDLIEAIFNGDTDWNSDWASTSPLPGATVAITDTSGLFPSILGAQTYGFFRFTSDLLGFGSSVVIAAGGASETIDGVGTPTADMIDALNQPTGGIYVTPVDGEDAGVQNNPTVPGTERERLLTHIIFSPVLKAANRTLTVTYTLTVSVARTS